VPHARLQLAQLLGPTLSSLSLGNVLLFLGRHLSKKKSAASHIAGTPAPISGEATLMGAVLNCGGFHDMT